MLNKVYIYLDRDVERDHPCRVVRAGLDPGNGLAGARMF